MGNEQEASQGWYDNEYVQHGFAAQRRYPSEELLRFLSREFMSKLDMAERKRTRILELGCGSCANLWMVAREGFDAWGIDFSPTALELGKRMLDSWSVSAVLQEGSFLDLPYQDLFFDAVFETLSIHTLTKAEFELVIAQAARVLKPGGRFFSLYPSAASDAYRNHSPAEEIEPFTLNGIFRSTSPYAGQRTIFRFATPDGYSECLKRHGLAVTHLETVARSYRNRQEVFETLSVAAVKLS